MKRKVLSLFLAAAMTIAAIPSMALSVFAVVPFGDVNKDGRINLPDLVWTNNYLAGKATLTSDQLLLADVTHDNTVDYYDLIKLKSYLLGASPSILSTPGDADGFAIKHQDMGQYTVGFPINEYKYYLDVVQVGDSNLTFSTPTSVLPSADYVLIPDGLLIEDEFGYIYGTPTTTGEYTFQAEVSEGSVEMSGYITIEIIDPFEITYDNNGGIGTMTASDAEIRNPFVLPECTFEAPEGKVFKCWAIGSASGTRVYPGRCYQFNADAKLYAIWQDTPKGINFGTDGIVGDDHIYYGEYDYLDAEGTEPISWRVLDTSTNTGTDGLFLLSENALTGESVCFDNTRDPKINTWDDSDAQAWCTTFLGEAFDEKEQAAILATSKSDAACLDDNSLFSVNWESCVLDNDKVFFLSAEEVRDYISLTSGDALKAYYGENTVDWWLRSPIDYNVQYVGAVNDGGNMSSNIVIGLRAARPAFNLDTNDVLFTSAADGGKDDTVDGDLTAVSTTTPTEWKLTLKDTERSFNVTEATVTAEQGEVKTITYSDAETGDNEYISAMICDGNEVLYYGRLELAESGEDKTADITIPSDLAVGDYTLKVFNEQYNDDYKTDFSSNFCEIDLEVEIAHVHTPTLVAEASATCSEDGNEEYYVCMGCGDMFEDENGATPIDDPDDVVIPATGNHVGTGDWHKDADNHWKLCDCGEITDEAAHTPGAAATETTPQTCTVCGHEIAPALGHTHTFNTTLSSDNTGHWYAATCVHTTEKSGFEAHAPGAAATATTPQTCTICGYEIAPATGGNNPGGNIGSSSSSSSRVNYKIIKGANGEWENTSDNGLEFTSDGKFSEFLRIEIDGVTVSKSNYDAKSGSTIITLKPEYLKTLSAGTHKLTVVFRNDEVDTNFKVTMLDELAAGENIEFTEDNL